MPESVFTQTMPLDCAEAICPLEAPPAIELLVLALAFLTGVIAADDDSVEALAGGAAFAGAGAEPVAGALEESVLLDFLRLLFEVPLACIVLAAGALLPLDASGAAAVLVESAEAAFLWLRFEVLADWVPLLASAAG
jgi:hypothetical protein